MTEKGSRRPSIQDVARLCGVAPSTVSNALSGRRYVSEETRQRVLAAAEQLGYRANTLARSLRMQRSWTIGLVIANINNPFYPDIARGIEDIAAKQSWNLILCNTDYQLGRQEQALRALLDRSVDGVILASHPNDSQIEQLVKSSVPYVLLNKGHGAISGDYVGIDNEKGAMLATEHVIGLGHKRLAFICGHKESDAADHRLDGFIKTVIKHGLTVPDSRIAPGAFDFDSGRLAAERILREPDRPTAVIAASDMMALGVIGAAMDAGLKVPEDLSVVGFDDILMARMPGIQLTTVHVAKWQLGASAARFLLERIQGQAPEAYRERIYDVELVVRNTTAPPPAMG